MLEHIPTDNLRIYLIWQPVLSSDNRVSAERRSGEFANEKFTHLWDSRRVTGALWQRLLGMRSLAWDVYFLYGPDTEWSAEPDLPDFWVSQLNSATKARFELKTRELLGQVR